MRRKLARIFRKTIRKKGYVAFTLSGLLILMVIFASSNFVGLPLNDFKDDASGSQVSRELKDIASDTQPLNHKTDYLAKDILPESRKIVWNIMRDAFSVAYPLFSVWKDDNKSYCNEKINIMGKVLFRAKDIVLNTNLIKANADPETNMSAAAGQTAEDEYYEFQFGAFQVTCPRILPYFADLFYQDPEIPHIQDWYRSIHSYSKTLAPPVEIIEDHVYATARYEYTNVYWVIVDIYNVFVHCVLNKHIPSEVTVLLVDAHPKSPLDDLWKVIFGKVIRPNDLAKVTHFKDLTWTMSRTFSPFTNRDSLMTIPYLTHLRQFVLTRFYHHDLKPLGCTHLRVTFVWRHDYVAHPRNPDGVISRKIANEDELLETTRASFTNWEINGYQLDALSVIDQVRILSQTDILVGMHGAALAFSFLVSPGGGVIEFFPKYHDANDHMKRIAKSTGLLYKAWVNDDDALENIYRKTTKIPPDAMILLLNNMSVKICNGLSEKYRNQLKMQAVSLKPKKNPRKSPKGGNKVHHRIIAKPQN